MTYHILTYLLVTYYTSTAPYCEEERCGQFMSNDEHNFGTPRTGRTMQFTPHLEFVNTSTFEVRK